MDVLLVGDVLLVDLVGTGSLSAEPSAQQLHVAVGELLAEAVQELARGIRKEEQLALVGLAHGVALEAILVAALLLAHLAVPAQLLQALRLHLVGQVLGRTHLRATHIDSFLFLRFSNNFATKTRIVLIVRPYWDFYKTPILSFIDSDWCGQAIPTDNG